MSGLTSVSAISFWSSFKNGEISKASTFLEPTCTICINYPGEPFPRIESAVTAVKCLSDLYTRLTGEEAKSSFLRASSDKQSGSFSRLYHTQVKPEPKTEGTSAEFSNTVGDVDETFMVNVSIQSTGLRISTIALNVIYHPGSVSTTPIPIPAPSSHRAMETDSQFASPQGRGLRFRGRAGSKHLLDGNSSSPGTASISSLSSSAASSPPQSRDRSLSPAPGNKTGNSIGSFLNPRMSDDELRRLQEESYFT